jgi:CelD/BcsL family acetyltransferase involved in cellulose biosynthesis
VWREEKAMFPTGHTARVWSELRGLPLTGSRAWGLPLVCDGRVVHNAGKDELPGVFPSAAGGLPPRGDLPRDAVALVLHDLVDDDGVIARLLATQPEATAHRRYDCAVAEFGDDPEAYAHRQLSTKRRKRLRHDRRQIERRGQLAIEWVGPERVDAVFDAFFRTLCVRAAHTGRYDDNVTRARFLRELWRRGAGGDLWISVLWVGGRPVSFRTGFVVQDRFVGFMPSVDRDFDSASVGHLHMQMLLPELARKGVTAYYMGKGATDAKDIWGTGAYALWTVVVPVTNSPRARAAIAAVNARQRLRRTITARGWEKPLRRGLHWAALRRGGAYGRALRAYGARPR